MYQLMTMTALLATSTIATGTATFAIVGEEELVKRGISEGGWVVGALLVLGLGLAGAFAWLGRKHLDSAEKREERYAVDNDRLNTFIRTELFDAIERNTEASKIHMETMNKVVATFANLPCQKDG